jgi:hypothetical protein
MMMGQGPDRTIIRIRTSKETSPEEAGFFGIATSGSEHVTVSNCNVRQFTLGFLSDRSEGDWNHLVIENSSFNRIARQGMVLLDNAQNPGEFTGTVIRSQFNENGRIGGTFSNRDGVLVEAIDGTFTSSDMSKNAGSDQVGFFEATPSFLKLIDVTANSNGDGGIFTHPISQSLEIIRSTACFDDAIDGSPLGNDIAAFEYCRRTRKYM